ncbi:MAG: hypothetical protein ACOY4R_14825 [Pseudomonadota bacterium]
MKRAHEAIVRVVLIGTAMLAGAGASHAQITSPTSIPLHLFQENPSSNGIWRLGINVGIGSGAPQLYLFDTGSSLFNAVYNQSWWPGFTASPSTNNAPSSSLPTSVRYCYGTGACRGYEGNIVQVPSLSFYGWGATSPSATLSAAPGFQVNAVYAHLQDGVPTSVVGATSPPIEGYFYGTFGAADFVSLHNGYNAGGVLGQTMMSGAGARQGYVVSANGQKNPTSDVNGPQQINGQTVTVGGQSRPVTGCSPCVTVGLTPEILGQFMVATPGTSGLPGMVPWTQSGSSTFPNPYGTGPGNNSTSEFGSNYTVTLKSAAGQTFTVTGRGLLDTGTANLLLSSGFNVPALSGNGTSIDPGVTLTVGGATAGGGAVSGLANAAAVTLTAQPSTTPNTLPANNAYHATFAAGTTNTIGLSFFLQNSVLYDLTDQAVAYTPFFVTAAPVATTANGPLVIGGANVPLGLAGVVSGAGGLTIGSGGAAQLSAANTYTGVTTIAAASTGMPAGQLLISGPGSIASSAGVVNNGILDISRAWAPVSIQSLSARDRSIWVARISPSPTAAAPLLAR